MRALYLLGLTVASTLAFDPAEPALKRKAVPTYTKKDLPKGKAAYEGLQATFELECRAAVEGAVNWAKSPISTGIDSILQKEGHENDGNYPQYYSGKAVTANVYTVAHGDTTTTFRLRMKSKEEYLKVENVHYLNDLLSKFLDDANSAGSRLRQDLTALEGCRIICEDYSLSDGYMHRREFDACNDGNGGWF